MSSLGCVHLISGIAQYIYECKNIGKHNNLFTSYFTKKGWPFSFRRHVTELYLSKVVKYIESSKFGTT